MVQRNVIVNFILYEIGWLACVIGAANRLPWIGVAIAVMIVAWHLTQAKQPKCELALLFMVLVIGGIFDQIMLNHQFIVYQSHGWETSIVPVWILALWAEFATILNVSLRWMHGRWLFALLFGAMGGPLAYLGAAKLGAVTLHATPNIYIVLGACWAFLTPLMLALAAKFDGFDYKHV